MSTSTWVGNELNGLGKTADDAFLDKTKKTIKDVQTLLEGGEPRAPVDFEKGAKNFLKGQDLSTPDGGAASLPGVPNDAKGGGQTLSSTLNFGRTIEFIHYGYVHHDSANRFDNPSPLDDEDGTLDLSTVTGGRAVAFHAALQRECILLGCFAQAVMAALDEKEAKEGKTTDLLDVAADLVGGAARKTKDTAASADMTPFITKLNAIWSTLDPGDGTTTYTDLHAAGIKLHELRSGLYTYLYGLVGQKSPDPSTPGLLSDLPLVGHIPLPGVLGDAVGFLQKITGKIFDVQMKLCFGLILSMHGPIEKACNDLALDAIRKRRAAIYPIWYTPPPQDGGGGANDPPFAAMKNPVSADGLLQDIKPLSDAVGEVGKQVGYLNQDINDAVKTPMKYVDLLSQPVADAPGNPFLADAFQASSGKGEGLPVFQGSEALADLAVSTIMKSIVDPVPDFMQGPVGEVAAEIFRIAVEFLRGVYAVLCTYPSVTIDTGALLAAGRKHILQQLVNVVTEKLGIDRIFEKVLSFTIPTPPFVPAGIDFPSGKTLTAAPILAKVKDVLEDKIQPYLAPVIDYATSGLAARLTAARTWAGPNGLTMEVHLGQLPVEIAILFRHLFGPLWKLVTDTIMGAMSDAVAEIMGPAAQGIGYAKDVVGKVSGIIADAEAMAKHARDYAAKVEEKAKDLLSKLSSVHVGTGDTGDLGQINQAAKALESAVGEDILGGGAGDKKDKPTAAFIKVDMFDPSTRKTKGKGKKIDPGEYQTVSAQNQWDKALPLSGAAANGDAGSGGSGGAAGGGGAGGGGQ